MNRNGGQVGTVIWSERKIVVFDIAINPLSVYHDEEDTEYVITINGTVIKRMTRHQAERIIGVGEVS